MTRSKPTDPASLQPNPVAGKSMQDSAQEIWQAGLAAFTRAQVQGSQAFEAMVREGIEVQKRHQTTAQASVQQAGQQAAGQWGKLENLFEDRVAQALRKLGMPTARDLDALNQRLDALTRAVELLAESRPDATPVRPRRAAKAPAKP